MPLPERIGDLLIVGFDGYDAPPHVLERIRRGRAGGIILFDRNIRDADQVRALTDALQAARAGSHDTPLIIAIDQEGGTVARLRAPWPEFPGNMALGATDDPALAERTGHELAVLLRELGITLNLAPVLDLASHAENPGIGVRSFGADPARVAALGGALITGMQRAGLAATAKHFPGMGDARQDAHDVLPIVDTSWRDLQLRHMAPFIAAMEAGVAALMTAHCAYPQYDRMTRQPVTINRRLWQEVVRRELGYEGAIISDCLEMRAFTAALTPESGATTTVMAGVDLLLVCHTPDIQDAVYTALLDAAERGLIAERVLDEAAARGHTLRTFSAGRPIPAGTPEETAATSAARALTVLRPYASWPGPSKGPVTVLVPAPIRQTAVEHAADKRLGPFIQVLEANGCPTVVGDLDGGWTPQDEGPVVLVTANAHLHPEQAARAQAALARASGPVLVAAVRNPFDAALFPAHTVALTYGDTPPSLRALAAWLVGDASAPGLSPVPLQSGT